MQYISVRDTDLLIYSNLETREIFDCTALTTNKLASFQKNECHRLVEARKIFLSYSFHPHFSSNYFPVKGHTLSCKCVSIGGLAVCESSLYSDVDILDTVSRHLLIQGEHGASRDSCQLLYSLLSPGWIIADPRATFFSLSNRIKICQPFHLLFSVALGAEQKYHLQGFLRGLNWWCWHSGRKMLCR